MTTAIVLVAVVALLGVGLGIAHRRRQGAYDAESLAEPSGPGTSAWDEVPDYDCFLHFSRADSTLVFEHAGTVVVTGVAVWVGGDLSRPPDHRRPTFAPGDSFVLPFDPTSRGLVLERRRRPEEDCFRFPVELRARHDDEVVESSWDTVWVE